MHSDSYDDPPLWMLIDEMARWTRGDLTMSRLAAQVKGKTGYAGAYRAIGRLVAAGYAEYYYADVTTESPIRTGVKLTDRGRSRWAQGASWPGVVAAQIRGRRGYVTGGARPRDGRDRVPPGQTA